MAESGLGAASTVIVDESTPSSASFIDDVLAAAAAKEDGNHNGPIVIIIVGMAASGKTTFTQRLTAELLKRGTPPYNINLDPACNDPPYPVNIDIRDTVKYKQVMSTYNLGPNGAIVTSLNLFATKFNEVLNIIREKKNTHQYILIDTPGQIEVFMWSASGNIITESIAAFFPTVMVYVTDLVSNQSPITFISNMTYACSILYKTKLPLVIALNKCDLVDPSYAKKWITDYEAFDEALRERDDYSSNLASSLALGLDEFYNKIDHVVISAYDGFGVDDFFCAVQRAVKDYETVYRPMYDQLLEERKKDDLKKKKINPKKLKDLKEVVPGRFDGEDESCYALPGRDAGAGLSLRLDNDEDTSSDEEDPTFKTADENEEKSFGEMLVEESGRRKEKAEKAETDKNMQQ